MADLITTEDLAIEAHDFKKGECVGAINGDGVVKLCDRLAGDPNIGAGHIHALQRRGRVAEDSTPAINEAKNKQSKQARSKKGNEK